MPCGDIMKKKDIVIVVPIYKEAINITEQFSIEQLYSVLGDYVIMFIAPKRMERFCHESRYNTVFFDDSYFNNTSTYSELLLSDLFYAKFADFKYMLIYQLDAFVFRDELLDFCNLGYDYIGAPVPRTALDWRKINARVGNGGLSLRKISSVRRVIKNISEICSNKDVEALVHKYEDMFFGLCGVQRNVDFLVPDTKTALKFAVDEDFSRFFKRLSNGTAALPFGCHGWNRYTMYPLWRKFLTNDDFKIKKIDEYFNSQRGLSYKEVQWYRHSEYLLSRCMRYYSEELAVICSKYLDRQTTYILWGFSQYAITLYNFLKECGYRVDKVFDRNPKGKQLDGKEIVVPDWDYVRNRDCKIAVTAIYADIEIEKEILAHGFDEGRIITYRKLLGEIMVNYVRTLLNRMKE